MACASGRFSERSPLFLLRIFSSIEEAVNGLSEPAIEGSNGRKWHFDETVLPRSFHQLSNPICVIEVHDHIQPGSAGDADNLTELRETRKYMI